MSQPILITGTFRAGTTLISQIMRNHSDIELVYDSVNFMRFSYNRYNPISDFNNVKKLVNEIWERINKRWDMQFSYKEVIKELKGESCNYGIIYDAIMSNLLLKKSSATIWGEKTTLVWTKIPDFFKMFPDGRVIHIVRDPRAVLASWEKMTHAPGLDYLDSIFNCKDSMKLALNYKNEFSNKKYINIKFEDLVTNPKNVIKDTCKFLDLKFEQEMLKTSSFISKNGDKWQGNSMFEDQITGFSKKPINKWKKSLKNWEVWLVEHIISNLLDDFNYQSSKVILNQKQKSELIKKIEKSQLLVDGYLKSSVLDEGVERFPSDPLDSKNWGED